MIRWLNIREHKIAASSIAGMLALFAGLGIAQAKFSVVSELPGLRDRQPSSAESATPVSVPPPRELPLSCQKALGRGGFHPDEDLSSGPNTPEEAFNEFLSQMWPGSPIHSLPFQLAEPLTSSSKLARMIALVDGEIKAVVNIQMLGESWWVTGVSTCQEIHES